MRAVFSTISFVLFGVLAACGGTASEDSPDSSSAGSGGSSAGSGGSSAGKAGSSAGSGGSSAGSAGSSAGSGGSSAGSGGAGGSDTCGGVVGSGPGPYDVTFTLTNPTQQSIWLWQDCQLEAAISACSDYATPLATTAACTPDCDDFQGCFACGPCMSAPIHVAPGESKPLSWTGHTYTYGTVQSCACHHTSVAPAGKYRLSVSVWDTAPPDGGPQPPADRVVTYDFELHTKLQAETVSLGP